MKTLALAVLTLSIALTPVYAAEELSGEKLNWVMTSIHDETVECWAYYGLVGSFGTISGDNKLASQLKPILDLINQRIENLGKIINIKDEAVAAKFVLVLKKLEKILDGNPSNFPILIAKYGDSCQWAIENVQPRIDFYTAQYEKKFEN